MPTPPPLGSSDGSNDRAVDDLLARLLEIPPFEWDGVLRDVDDSGIAAEARRRLAALAEHGLASVATELPTPPYVGDRLDDGIVLEEVAGEGGSSIVFRARRADGTNCAIKLLHPRHFADRAMHERFRREVARARQVDGGRVCKLVGNGSARGLPYLVLEWLEGIDLDSWIAERERAGRSAATDPATRREFVERVAETCEAVEAVHRCGFVHRDIKPSNVMLTARGAVLIDLGLLRPDGDVRDALSSLTGSHEVAGTLPYLAPEQVHQRPCDARTDVYALGVMLYRGLAGRLPFPVTTHAPAAVVLAIARGDKPPLKRVAAATPEHLCRVVEMATEVNPLRRHPTAAGLAGDLRSILAGREPIAPAARLRTRLRRFWRRSPVQATVILALTLGLIALSVPIWRLLVTNQALRVQNLINRSQAASGRPEVALRDALAALALENTVEIRSNLVRAASSFHELARIPAAGWTDLVLSPDGKTLAFRDGMGSLCLLPIDALFDAPSTLATQDELAGRFAFAAAGDAIAFIDASGHVDARTLGGSSLWRTRG